MVKYKPLLRGCKLYFTKNFNISPPAFSRRMKMNEADAKMFITTPFHDHNATLAMIEFSFPIA